jgi:TIR domain-containing protein
MNQRLRDALGKDSRIFISYRRTDSAHAGRLYADLRRNFGAERIFMDTAGIEGGDDFVRVIAERLGGSKVLIAVIGTQWLKLPLEARDSRAGATDWVRLEIVTALEKRIPIIPVLVNNAEMPHAEKLPEDLKALARVQAVRVGDERWDLDVAYLNTRLEEIVAPKSRRVAAVLLVLLSLASIGIGLLSYHLATKPWPAKPQADGKFNLPPVIMGTQEAIIEGPKVNTDVGLLLSHAAEPTDEIRVEIDKAQLTAETISDLDLDPGAASASGKITYGPVGPEDTDVSKRPCTTSIEVSLKDKTLPNEIHFSQPKSGGKDYRELEVSAGADLFVSMSANPRSGADEKVSTGLSETNGPGCGKQLLFASNPPTDHMISGPYQVEVTAAANSPVRFRFTPLPNSPLWEGEAGPFAFGSPKLKLEDPPAGLEARAVRIRSSNGESIYEIRGIDETRLLRIDALAVDPDRLRISVASDAAFVTVNDEDGVGIRQRVADQPVKAVLLACTAVALIICLAFLLRRLLLNQR